jgi:hypothetical protein
MGIYTFIDSLNNQILFRNIVILLVFIYFFMRLTIGLNIILALVLGIITVLYFDEKETLFAKLETAQLHDKLKTIQPKTDKVQEMARKDLIEFLFSIQDFYVFNPPAYEEMMDNINSFLTLHESTFLDDKLCNYYYQIAESKKNNALNSFHSIIFKLPNDKIFTDKFNRAHRRLETLLNIYLNEMYDQCYYVLVRDGHDVLKRPTNTGPKEYNQYFDKVYTYQIY